LKLLKTAENVGKQTKNTSNRAQRTISHLNRKYIAKSSRVCRDKWPMYACSLLLMSLLSADAIVEAAPAAAAVIGWRHCHGNGAA